MPRSMLVLGAAAIALAACGSDKAEKAAKDAANAAANTANTAADTAANAAGDAGNAAANTADTAAEQGEALGKSGTAPAKGQQGAPKIKLNLKKVEFAGCSRQAPESKPGICVIVKSGSETYDISSAKPRPILGRAIAGTGIYLPNQQGICMAGKPLTGVKWRYTQGHCVKGKLTG